ALLDGALGTRLHSSFVPEEDSGFFFVNVQLPPAASLERTDEVCRKIDRILAETKGVDLAATIAGFSLLTRVSATNTAFYFVALKPWDDRRPAPLHARAIVDSLNRRLATQVPEAVAFGFMPPSIPGLGNSGGFSLWLQDRSGGSVEFLDQNMVPLSALVTTSHIVGPEFTNRFNLYRAAQVIGGAAPGYSSGQALDALEEVAKATLPPEISYDWADLSYQERKASGTAVAVFGLSSVFVFLILAALYA